MDNYVEPYDPDTDVNRYLVNFTDEPADPLTPPPQPEPPLQLGGIHFSFNFQRLERTALARQRERTADMRLQDLEHYFHFSEDEAAQQLNICKTTLKKICRRNGLDRWPGRKIRAINRRIEEMERTNPSQNYIIEIQAAKLEREQIYESVRAAKNN